MIIDEAELNPHSHSTSQAAARRLPHASAGYFNSKAQLDHAILTGLMHILTHLSCRMRNLLVVKEKRRYFSHFVCHLTHETHFFGSLVCLRDISFYRPSIVHSWLCLRPDLQKFYAL